MKEFRQWESRTPGHPENFETPGIEVTTGWIQFGVCITCYEFHISFYVFSIFMITALCLCLFHVVYLVFAVCLFI